MADACTLSVAVSASVPRTKGCCSPGPATAEAPRGPWRADLSAETASHESSEAASVALTSAAAGRLPPRGRREKAGGGRRRGRVGFGLRRRLKCSRHNQVNVNSEFLLKPPLQSSVLKSQPSSQGSFYLAFASGHSVSAAASRRQDSLLCDL